MPRKKVGVTAPGPRTSKGLLRRQGVSSVNIKHELFAAEYMIDMDAGAAYVRAGYNVTEGESADVCGRRLLRNARVWELIEAAQLKRIAERKMDADKVLLRLEFVYEQAAQARDWPTALATLREIGKHYGIFEKHQAGKTKYTETDIPRLKAQLEAAGWNYKDKSYEKAQAPSSN